MKDMIKVVNVEVEAVNDEVKNRTGTDEQRDLDVCFARFEVGERHPLERQVSDRKQSGGGADQGIDNGDGNDSDDESDEEIMQQIKEAVASEPEEEHAPVTNIGDSICGQRALEQHPSGSSKEAQHGIVAGELVKRLSKKEAAAIAAEALAKDGFIFKWHQTHEKGGISGERFAAYSKNVKTREDFFRESKTKFYKGQKNSITRADLVDDVSKGLLTFEKTILNVAKHEEQRTVVDYIRGREKGVVHRILTVQPRTTGIEQDPVFEMWSRNRDAKMSLQDMRLLSASVFLLEKGEAGSVPTYEVRTLREALRSEHWDSHWRPACEAELEGLAKRGVWESVHRSEVPKGANIVPSKLVFKIKVDPDNNFHKMQSPAGLSRRLGSI